MTFDMLMKLRSTSNHSSAGKTDVVKHDMSNDESETSRCCDLSLVDENSENDEPTIESKLMELQDDLKAKTSQCTILRDTLSTMSATMRRQEFQLEEKIAQIELHLKTIEEMTTERNEWRRKYEDIEKEMEKLKSPTITNDVQMYLDIITEKSTEFDDLRTRYEALVSKIESGVNASEKLHLIHHQINKKVPSSPYSANERRPWKGERNSIPTTNCDDEGSTTSDSIDHPYLDQGIKLHSNPKRSPRRAQKSKRNVNNAEEHAVSQTSFPFIECQQSDVIVPTDSILHIADSAVVEAHNSDSADSKNSLLNLVNQCTVKEPLPALASHENEVAELIDPLTNEGATNRVLEEREMICPDSSDGEMLREQFANNVGFSFDVEVPFSDPESDNNVVFRPNNSRLEYPSILQYPGEDKFENTSYTATIDLERSMHEVEILSLNHFIELYDKYKVDEVEDIKCAVDLKPNEEEDNISVVSFASMDSSVPADHKSIAASTVHEKQAIRPEDHKKESKRCKDAKQLRKRVIRTAKREAKKAQFNCEAVEC